MVLHYREEEKTGATIDAKGKGERTRAHKPKVEEGINITRAYASQMLPRPMR